VVERLPTGTTTLVVSVVECAAVVVVDVVGAAVVLGVVDAPAEEVVDEELTGPDADEAEPLVVLELTEPDADEVEELVALPPVMVNGNEYWKVFGSESSTIFRPYTARLPSVGSTAHEYLPTELTMPAKKWNVS
jgi:hypothetical protein